MRIINGFTVLQYQVHCRKQGNHRFSRSNVSLEEASHCVGMFHIFEDLEQYNFLLIRERKGKISNERLDEFCIERSCGRESF